MVQCAACKRWGYRQDAPPRFFGRDHLVKHFEEMKLDDRHIPDFYSFEGLLVGYGDLLKRAHRAGAGVLTLVSD